MDDFVLIIAVFITVLIIILTITKEDFSLCSKKPPTSFFERLLDYLNSLFYPKKKEKKQEMDNSFTVPVDQRNELMHDSKNGKKYYWSWQ
jgi:hypothetical protein|tara:strand:- start:182 stop:451 length:270 start_codon:yes stop_codon:yes gene_type:complete